MFSERIARDDPRSDFLAELRRARSSGRPHRSHRIEPFPPPPRWDPPAALGALMAGSASAPPESPQAAGEARVAVSRYLADRGREVAPEPIVLAASTRRACAFLLQLLCRAGDQVLVPSAQPFPDRLARSGSVHVARYPLRYDGTWRLDRKALARAVNPRTRAIFVASPSTPAGAVLSEKELAFLEKLGAEEGLALVGDESLADTAIEAGPSVCDVSRCLAFHVSGMSTICGLERMPSWIALAGPGPVVSSALAGLERIAGAHRAPFAPALRATPPLLVRRRWFLDPLVHRIRQNQARLAMAALREAPWALLRSGGGWWATLQINPAQEEDVVCRGLLVDGVVVRPGFLDGLDPRGYLVLSLLTEPGRFTEGLDLLERRLRRSSIDGREAIRNASAHAHAE